MSESASSEASTRTVVVAVGVNLAIAFAKGIAAALTGSAALWAETAHSLVDTGNEVLLFVGLRRSGRPTRPPRRSCWRTAPPSSGSRSRSARWRCTGRPAGPVGTPGPAF